MREINQKGFELLTSFEGCELKAYQDQGGIWTIGYGHTGSDVTEGKTITGSDAYSLLSKDLLKFEAGVTRLVTKPINDNQFSALVCLSYNIGLTNLHNSTLLKNLNAGDLKEAAQQFLVWNHINGVVSPGLTRRRHAEKSLFESTDL